MFPPDDFRGIIAGTTPVGKLQKVSWIVGQFETVNFTISSVVHTWSLMPAAIAGVVNSVNKAIVILCVRYRWINAIVFVLH